MILLYLVYLEWILKLNVILTYVHSYLSTFEWRCASLCLRFDIALCFTVNCGKNELQSTALLQTKASWIVKTIFPLNNNPNCYSFTAASVDLPSEGWGRRQRDGITGRGVTLHSRLASRAISHMCKSNLNPRRELLYTENWNLKTAARKWKMDDYFMIIKEDEV